MGTSKWMGVFFLFFFLTRVRRVVEGGSLSNVKCLTPNSNRTRKKIHVFLGKTHQKMTHNAFRSLIQTKSPRYFQVYPLSKHVGDLLLVLVLGLPIFHGTSLYFLINLVSRRKAVNPWFVVLVASLLIRLLGLTLEEALVHLL